MSWFKVLCVIFLVSSSFVVFADSSGYPSYLTQKMIDNHNAIKMHDEANESDNETTNGAIELEHTILVDDEYIINLCGHIMHGNTNITKSFILAWEEWAETHFIDISRLNDILIKSAYIASKTNRGCPINHVFIIGDEMSQYAFTHQRGAFASNWKRFVNVAMAESGARYWLCYHGPVCSDASGLYQFLSSTAGWFAAKEMQRVCNAVLHDTSGDAIKRASILLEMKWATTQSLAFGLMRPHTGSHNNSVVPTINSPRSISFQRLIDQHIADGMSLDEAFAHSVEDVIRYQVQMGCRLLDAKSGGWWSQWEVCTRYGI